MSLVLGLEVKNDISGQSNDSLRVCNVKIRKCLLGQKWGIIIHRFRWGMGDGAHGQWGTWVM